MVAHVPTVGPRTPGNGCATHDETLTSGLYDGSRTAVRPNVPV